jgi:hypothetical protein
MKIQSSAALAAMVVTAQAVCADIRVPQDVATIQGAIDAASAGDSILIAPGTYFELIDLRGKAVTLRGTGGAEVTILDGQQQGTVITGANEPASCLIEGLQIRNGVSFGNGGSAGGLSLTNSAATVRNCVFTRNLSMGWWGGGAVRTSGGSTKIEDCMFIENANGDEPGGSAWHHLGGGSFAVRRCRFVGNTSNANALGGQTGGYAMKVNPEGAICDGVIEDCDFAACKSGVAQPNYWGVIALHRASQPIRITNCRFSAVRGGQPMAILSGMDSAVSISGCAGCGFTVGLQGSGTTTGSTFVPSCPDCNSNGIPDLEEIATGTVTDTNHDSIPDVCQCDADLNRDGRVDGADLASILAFWGPTGTVFPAADLNHDGRVDGFDLSAVLGSWGPCGQ